MDFTETQVGGPGSTYFFLFLHKYVRYAGMCISSRLHMCLRVYKNPKLARGVLLVCSLSYILR